MTFKVLLGTESSGSFEFWPHAVVDDSSHPLGDEPHVFGEVFEVALVKQLLREVFLPLDLAFRGFRHIRNCIRNEELHGVDDVLQEREKTPSEGRGVPEVYSRWSLRRCVWTGHTLWPFSLKAAGYKGVTCQCSVELLP